MKAMATNQTISWFFQRQKDNTLELSPSFQRNSVWPSKAKEALIDTILLNLPIPEIYLVNKVTIEGISQHIVVDGQQRIRSILEFINGDVKLKGDLREKHGFSKFSEMPDLKKQEFWRYPIVVRDLEDSSDPEIRDLFQRLNRNTVTLNDQELRNAKYDGEFINEAERIADLPFWMENRIFSASDIRRMRDIEYVSSLLALLIGGIQNRNDKLDQFYDMYNDSFEEKERYTNRFHEILHLIAILIDDIPTSRWKNKAEFYTLFSVLDRLLDAKFPFSDYQDKVKFLLADFERKINNAKLKESDPIYQDYLDAATQGTNNKESRVRRTKILYSEFYQAFSDLLQE